MNSIVKCSIDNDSSMNFRWKWTKTNEKWDQKIKIFTDLSSESICTLSVQCNLVSGIDCCFTFSLVFPNSDLCYESTFFELIFSFYKSINNGYYSKLFKDEDIPTMFNSLSTTLRFPFYNSSCIYVTIKLMSNLQKKVDCKLVQDIKQILHDNLSDLKLIAKDSSFQVHKCILAARSKVFDKIINTDMIEKKTSEIKLVEWDSSVVKELLNYVYTGICNIKNIACDLFRLAHYLEMIELQNLCTTYLKFTISRANIVSILELTSISQLGLNNLKEAATVFVSTNIEKLIKDDNYQEYLKNTIDLSNITYILELSKKYNIEKLLPPAMEFVRLNYKSVLSNDQCEIFFSGHPDVFMNIFKYSLDLYESSK